MMTLRTILIAMVVTAALAMPGARALASLTADDLLLVVNKNVPSGRELAEHYAKARGVPDGRIIEIDAPDTFDVSAQAYREKILAPVRAGLTAPERAGKIKCVVLFFGVPVHVEPEKPTQSQVLEATNVNKILAVARGSLRDSVEGFEKVVVEIEPAYQPPNQQKEQNEDVEFLIARAQQAEAVGKQGLSKLPDSPDRQAKQAKFLQAMQSFTKLPPVPGLPGKVPATQPTFSELSELLTRSSIDPVARTRMRELAYQSNNILSFAKVVNDQSQMLSFEDVGASVDSELSMALWPGYQRARFIGNPLHWRVPQSAARPLTMMTARIDGPTVELARARLDESMDAEREGQSGNYVIDTRGHRDPKDPYSQFDQWMRNYAALAIKGAGMEHVLVDEREELLPSASASGVAIYAGWTKYRSPNSPCSYVPGAIAIHIASFELLSWNGDGWCPALMKDGAAVTVGSVEEPYASAFPRPDEFFPMILTGKTTLAEAYWKTIPWTSWKMVLIGDPLYRPYSKKPVLTPEDLPEHLRGLLDAK
jgi:uncharacterized protein (TIGR03790 family)